MQIFIQLTIQSTIQRRNLRGYWTKAHQIFTRRRGITAAASASVGTIFTTAEQVDDDLTTHSLAERIIIIPLGTRQITTNAESAGRPVTFGRCVGRDRSGVFGSRNLHAIFQLSVGRNRSGRGTASSGTYVYLMSGGGRAVIADLHRSSRRTILNIERPRARAETLGRRKQPHRA